MLSPEAEVGGFFQLGVVDSLGRDLIPIVIVECRPQLRHAFWMKRDNHPSEVAVEA